MGCTGVGSEQRHPGGSVFDRGELPIHRGHRGGGPARPGLQPRSIYLRCERRRAQDPLSARPDPFGLGAGPNDASAITAGKRTAMIKLPKKQRASSVLGLSLDGNLLAGVVLRRTNGSLVLQKTISASLSLDPLTNDPELVGREIQNHLEKAGIRDRPDAALGPFHWGRTL